MPSSPAHLDALVRLLDGYTELNTLHHLNVAMGTPRREPDPDATIAIGIDANVLLNLGKGRSGADVVDYLGQKHAGPVILPHQVIVEFWNNQAGGIHALADGLRRQFEDLSTAIEQLDPDYSHFRDGSRRLLEDFAERYGHVMEERVASQLTTLLEVLEGRALTPQLPRDPFDSIARRRQATRTPPGFKDDGHGDFYVWGEFLLGLLVAGEAGAVFTRAVLVTDDRKPDWSTKGTTHPSLCSEVEALTGASFETWSLPTLTRFVESSLSDEAADGDDASGDNAETAAPSGSDTPIAGTEQSG